MHCTSTNESRTLNTGPINDRYILHVAFEKRRKKTCTQTCWFAGDAQRGFTISKNSHTKPVRLILLAKSTSHSIVFFSHNKSANRTFCHDLQLNTPKVFYPFTELLNTCVM